jgi:hypothetical protein
METWKFNIHIEKDGERISFQFFLKGTEEKTDDLFDALILGYQMKGYRVSGGKVRVNCSGKG